MRRLAYIAAFTLVLTIPVWAQRGGHGGGSGHAGFGGARSGGFASRAGGGGHFGGARSFSGGMRSGGMRAPASSRGFNHSFNRTFANGSFHNHGFGNHGFHDRRFHNGFHNNCFGFGCGNWGWNSGWGWGWGSPWWGWNAYDPWIWSTWEDEDRRFDEDYYRQYAMADEWNQRQLQEIQMMRQEEQDGDQDAYAPPSYAHQSAQSSPSQPEPMLPPTVLVYRDQHKEEVSNYAIVGQTLWSFSAQHTKKIPLSDLDIPATEKANDDRGMTFNVPAQNSGQ